MLRCCASLVAVVVAGCVSSREPEWLVAEHWTSRCSEDVVWLSETPIEFLASLSRRSGSFEIAHCAYVNWVRLEHVPALIALLDSDERAGSVYSSISSFYPTGGSTVGAEAAYLIEGYRKGRYPPGLNSNRHDVDREEIRRWWRELETPDRPTSR